MQQLSSGVGVTNLPEDIVVYIGWVHKEEEFFIMTQGFNVRKYGTTKGLGQLALEGPTSETALDEVPPILIPEGKLCHMMAVSESVWEPLLK